MFSILVSSFTQKLNIDEFIKNQALNKKMVKILFTNEQIDLINKDFNLEKDIFDQDILNILNQRNNKL